MVIIHVLLRRLCSCNPSVIAEILILLIFQTLMLLKVDDDHLKSYNPLTCIWKYCCIKAQQRYHLLIDLHLKTIATTAAEQANNVWLHLCQITQIFMTERRAD